MSNNWNQPPDNNDQPTPPKTGGLLRNYKTQQPSSAGSQSQSGIGNGPLTPGSGQFSPPSKSGLLRSPGVPPSQPLPGQMQQPPIPPSYSSPMQPNAQSWSNGGPAQPQANPAQGAPFAGQPGPSHARSAGLLSNTMQMMRQWSGKMAALAGYQPPPVEPPAPYLERYSPQTPSGSGIGTMPSAPDKGKPWKRSRAIRIARQMRHRRERWQNGPTRLWSAIAIALLFIVLFTSFGSSFYGYNYYQQQLPRVQELYNLQVAQNTRIYDRNGVLLYQAYDSSEDSQDRGRRIPIKIDQVPKVMQDAMVAIEDKTFWTNNGVDPQGILRAASKGGGGGGGSTLTQQIIKNLTHDDTPSITRKIPEAALAIGLTQQYTKKEILQMYMNIAPFGTLDNGVESAAQTFFKLQSKNCYGADAKKCQPAISQLDLDTKTGKKSDILALARASILAGIPNNPSLYDPSGTAWMRENALSRQKLVLAAMMEQGMKLNGKLITPAMAKEAENMASKMQFSKYSQSKRAPHFVDWIIEQVATALGNGDFSKGYSIFKRAGLNIKTTVDVKLVDYTEKVIQRQLTEPVYQEYPDHAWVVLNRDKNVNTSAAIVMDAKTGEILSMVGSLKYDSTDPKVKGAYNVAAPPNGDTGRAPGSTMKPLVYASAFQMGWNPGIALPDAQTYIPNGANAGTPIPMDRDKPVEGIYVPHSYGDTYNAGNQRLPNDSIRYATANSFNVPAVKAMQFAGPNNVLDLTRRLGITTFKNNGTSWALGSQNVPLIQMVGAYQTFANSGKHIPPQGVLDIWDNEGNNLFHYDPNPAKLGTQVLSPQVSYMTTSVLIDQPARHFEFFGNTILSFADRDPNCDVNVNLCQYQVATKTGTTDEFKDNLTIGYTPEVVVGVWSGNADNSNMNNIVGITGAAPIWHSVMENTMGLCRPYGPYYDGVDCGSPYKFRFSGEGKTQWTFTKPEGVSQAYMSKDNGLSGSGITDWVIDGQQANVDGKMPGSQFNRGQTPDEQYGKPKN